LDSCFEGNVGLKNLIAYLNKNIKKINNKRSDGIITEGEFSYNFAMI